MIDWTVANWHWIVMPGVLVGFLVGLLVAISQGGMAALARQYPAAEPMPGTELRPCASLVVGVTRMSGGLLVIGGDAGFLHIRPSRFLEGHDVGGASVPWDAVVPETLTPAWPRNGEKLTRLRLRDGTKLVVPTWCLERFGDLP